jgi:sulfate adenylyltransferase subunit 2
MISVMRSTPAPARSSDSTKSAQPPSSNNEAKVKAVELRLAGQKLATVAKQTGLSTPTISALIKAYEAGGWDAITSRAAGRPKGGSKSGNKALADLKALFLAAKPRTVWSSHEIADWLANQLVNPLTSQAASNERAAVRRLADWGLLPPDVFNQAGHFYPQRDLAVLWARGPKGEVYLQVCPLPIVEVDYLRLVEAMLANHPRGFSLKFAEDDFAGLRYTPKLAKFLAAHPTITFTETQMPSAAQKTEAVTSSTRAQGTSAHATPARNAQGSAAAAPSASTLTHLQRLEAESIAIMREVVAEADNPVMLYSIGKDSAVMLHLAVKAFYPARIPFPLLHVDTTWKFQDMYRFRERMQKEHDFKLLVHTNPEGLARGINPFTHGSQIHTDIMKTVALKQALDQHGFDVAFGGARRDEEKSRAKERVFSFRTKDHRWDPKNQRPELWSLYNTKKHKGESIRVFPISNWTELDIWQYIYLENIPIVPLYLSAPRPVVSRDGTLIMVDDDRMPLAPGEVPMVKSVRFRTLGCYPLTGAVESTAATLEEVIQEMLLTTTSERQGRVIDHDSAASMEKKKQEGYF